MSKRDFSFLGGFLSMGLWVLIGASLLSMFVGGAAFSLAIASVGVLLFGGYILFDTSRICVTLTNRDAVGAAIGLYLNFLNMFLFLLRILSSRRRQQLARRCRGDGRGALRQRWSVENATEGPAARRGERGLRVESRMGCCSRVAWRWLWPGS